jgi:hypothetical protein
MRLILGSESRYPGAMKTTVAVAFLLVISSTLTSTIVASDPSGDRRFETYFDEVSAVRSAMRHLKTGMTYEEAFAVFPRNSLKSGRFFGSFRIRWTYDVGRQHSLLLSFESSHLVGAELRQGKKVIAKFGEWQRSSRKIVHHGKMVSVHELTPFTIPFSFWTDTIFSHFLHFLHFLFQEQGRCDQMEVSHRFSSLRRRRLFLGERHFPAAA